MDTLSLRGRSSSCQFVLGKADLALSLVARSRAGYLRCRNSEQSASMSRDGRLMEFRRTCSTDLPRKCLEGRFDIVEGKQLFPPRREASEPVAKLREFVMIDLRGALSRPVGQ